MTAGAGVLRNADGLAAAAASLDGIGARRQRPVVEPCVEAWEATNLHTVANALVAGARLRAETRGCHWREDYPETSPAWRGHLVTLTSRRRRAGDSVRGRARRRPDSMSLPSALDRRLTEAGLDAAAVETLVVAALAEDLAGGVDVTSVAVIPADDKAVADFVSRAHGVVAGVPIAAAVLMGRDWRAPSRSTKASSTACASSRAQSSCRRRVRRVRCSQRNARR